MRTNHRRLSIGHWIGFSAVYIVVNFALHGLSHGLTPTRVKIVLLAGLVFGLLMSLTRPLQERIDEGVKRLLSRR